MDGVHAVVEVAVHVQRVSSAAEQDREVVGEDVAVRRERYLRRRAAHLQYADERRVASRLCNARQMLVFSAAPATYTQGKATSQSLRSPHDRHFVGITRYSYTAKIYRVIQIKSNQLV